MDEFDFLVELTLREVSAHPLPLAFLHVLDERDVDPEVFISLLVAHRAERLYQLTECCGAALDNLEVGSILISALAARAALEVAIVTLDVHSELEREWRLVHGDAVKVRHVASRTDAGPWIPLRAARTAARAYEAAGVGKSVNVLTRLNHVLRDYGEAGRTIRETYEMLCEVCHPNLESSAVYWRRGASRADGLREVVVEPAGSESPVKLAIVDSLRIAMKVLIPYIRDLWWIAAETASAVGVRAGDDASRLGLPVPGRRNDLCCCGSGLKQKSCPHDEPVLPSEEWVAARRAE